MSLWFVFVLVALATHRVTRLITRDAIPLIAVPREVFVQRWGSYADAFPEDRNTSIGGKRTNFLMRSIAYLWECDWCASVWVSAGITYCAWRWTMLGDEHWFVSVLVGLTASTVTGLIASKES